MTVSRYIQLLLLAVLFPVACGLCWLLYSGWQAQAHNIGDRLAALASQQQLLLDNRLASGQQVAATAAGSDWAKAMRGDRCNPVFLRQSLAGHPSFSNLVTLNRAGEVVCSVLPLDDAARLRVRQLPGLPALLQQTRPAISEPMFAPISRRWVSMITHPIRRQGEVVGLVILPIDLKALDRIALPADLPPSVGWQVLSAGGRRLQDRNMALPLGQPTAEATGALLRQQTVVASGWRVQVSLPFSALRASLYEQGWPLIGAMMLAVLVACVAGMLLARSLLRSVTALTSFVLRVGQGESSLRVTPKGPQELQLLGNEINRMLDAVEFSESRYRLLFGASTDGVVVVNRQMQILAVNEQGATMFGYDVDELAGESVNVLLPQELRAAHQHISSAYAANPVGRSMGHRPTLRGVRKDGSEVLVQITLSPLPKGSQGVVAAIIRDVSERQQLKDKLQWMTQYDALTRLPNRILLMDRLGQALQRATQQSQPLALILLGLDHFKVINDAYGHDCGDQVLIELTRRLVQAVGDGRTVARVAGDEFAVVVDDQASPQQLPALLDRIRQALLQPMERAGGEALQLSSSIGVALWPTDANDAGGLMRAADTALAGSKQLGRGGICFYQEELATDYRQELELEVRLRDAVARNQLVPYFQPIVAARTGRITGVEVLVRWPQATGMVSPALFLPLAESAGLLPKLEQQTRIKALEAVRQWNELGVVLQLSLNVSAGEFERIDFIPQLDKQLQRFRISPSQVMLEITESAVLHDQERAVLRMQSLHARGYRIAIDDFGTGYSSLSYLHTFPFDRLKLDRSFIAKLPQDQKAARITAAIITMAHDLELNVVAEGVETPEQKLLLQRMRCDALQGFHLHRPLPADEITRLLRAQSAEGAVTP